MFKIGVVGPKKSVIRQWKFVGVPAKSGVSGGIMAAELVYTALLLTSTETVWPEQRCWGRLLAIGTFRFTNNDSNAWMEVKKLAS